MDKKDFLIASGFTKEELILLEAIQDARKVQEFIWGELSLSNDTKYNANTWRLVFQKRVNKLRSLDSNHPHYKVELRKRILQQAALSICALKLIDKLDK